MHYLQEEMETAIDTKSYALMRLRHLVDVIYTLPDEIKKLDYKCNMPEYIRPYDEDYHKDWGQGYRLPLKAEDYDLADETLAMYWSYAADLDYDKKKMLSITMMIKAKGRGYRAAQRLLNIKKVKCSHTLCATLYESFIQHLVGVFEKTYKK